MSAVAGAPRSSGLLVPDEPDRTAERPHVHGPECLEALLLELGTPEHEAHLIRASVEGRSHVAA